MNNMKNHYIIDAHCHIYPEKIAQKATDSTDKFYGVSHAPFHGTAEELIKQSEETNIKKCLFNLLQRLKNKFQA